MRPGPDVDADIARKVFRNTVVFDVTSGIYWVVDAQTGVHSSLPRYSDLDGDYLEIVDFYRDRGWKFKTRREGNKFLVGFHKPDGVTYRSFRAETLATAVCIAALAIENGSHIQSR